MIFIWENLLTTWSLLISPLNKMYENISLQLSLHWILENIDFFFLEVYKDEVIFRENASWKIGHLCHEGKKKYNNIPVDSPAILFSTLMNQDPSYLN